MKLHNSFQQITLLKLDSLLTAHRPMIRHTVSYHMRYTHSVPGILIITSPGIPPLAVAAVVSAPLLWCSHNGGTSSSPLLPLTAAVASCSGMNSSCSWQHACSALQDPESSGPVEQSADTLSQTWFSLHSFFHPNGWRPQAQLTFWKSRSALVNTDWLRLTHK